ncbi:hypothetical protein EC973_001778 [Apophysomyces ossiformis]|uniref:Uncharacterized protein n=1 Tax=Apophysomyces ossiformis TaxID=679940 RepID=A0A8H7ERM7_9FUNG|nr:hypothetical protein EC973_001778 [Apophysomyces ossiformis]
MSGESQTSTNNRFGAMSKKYPGSPKSPIANSNTSGNRNGNNTRARLLTSKITAPRPINLPSLRRENAWSETPTTTAHPPVNTGWGSPSTSPFTSPQTKQTEIKSTSINSSPEQSTTSPTSNKNQNANVSPTLPKSPQHHESPLSPTSPPQLTRAWAVPSNPSTIPSTDPDDFPSTTESATVRKENVKDQKQETDPDAEPRHATWDEMVSEDLDFSVSVVEFADGTKVKVDTGEDGEDVHKQKEDQQDESEVVSPSDRFTEDYDRSYPPQLRSVRGDQTRSAADDHGRHGERGGGYYKPQRYEKWRNNFEEGRENGSLPPRYAQSYDRRMSSERSDMRGNHSNDFPSDRRPSNTSSERSAWGKHFGHDHTRRDSPTTGETERGWGRGRGRYDSRGNQEAKGGFHPTLLQRSRRMSDQSALSEHSRDESRRSYSADTQDASNGKASTSEANTTKVQDDSEERPPELSAAQREVMLTAAERAKKRRDEEEAELEASRERARQKAMALAEQCGNKSTKSVANKNDKSGSSETAETSAPKTIQEEKKQDERRAPKTSPAPSKPSDQPTADSDNEISTIVAHENPSINLAATTQVDNVSDSKTGETKKQEANEGMVEAKEHGDVTETGDEGKSGLDSSAVTVDTPPKKATFPMTEDDENWEQYVSQLKDSNSPTVSVNTTVNAWNSYASRLQKVTNERRQVLLRTAGHADATVEVHDYQRETRLHPSREPVQPRSARGVRSNREENQGRGIRGVGKESSDRSNRDVDSRPARGGGNRAETAVSWRRRSDKPAAGTSERPNEKQEDAIEKHVRDIASSNTEDQPLFATIETLSEKELPSEQVTKEADIQEQPRLEEEANEVSQPSTAPVVQNTIGKEAKQKKKRSKLHKSSSPIFPEAVERVALKKLSSISFMIDREESDLDITTLKKALVANKADTATEPEIRESIAESPGSPSIHQNDAKNVPSAEPGSYPTENGVRKDYLANTVGSPVADRHYPFPDPRAVSSNPNFPFLVYQFPNTMPFGVRPEQGFVPNKHQQHPASIYLVPPQQFQTGNQYMVAFSQAPSNMQPQALYPQALHWQPPPLANYAASTHSEHRPRRSSANPRSPRSPRLNKLESHQEPSEETNVSSPSAGSELTTRSADPLPWGQSANYGGRTPGYHRGRGGASRGRTSWSGRGRGYSGAKHQEAAPKEKADN